MSLPVFLIAAARKRFRQGRASAPLSNVANSGFATQKGNTGPLLAALLLFSALTAGCATVQNPDPLESVNRKVFAVNEGLDKAVLKPVATAYKAVVPEPARNGVSNFFSNLGDPWSGVNLMLQGQIKDGLSDVARFATNSTVGLLGLMDVASGWGMPRHGEGFDGTLGAWGVGTGAYLMLPLLGPSDMRNTLALPVNSLGSPLSNVADVPVRNSLTALNMVNKRGKMLVPGRLVDDIALDKYVFVRDVYLQRSKRGGANGESTEGSAENTGTGRGRDAAGLAAP